MSHVCVINANREHKVAGFAVALSHQETAVLALVKQQLLGIFANNVTVKPPESKHIHRTLENV